MCRSAIDPAVWRMTVEQSSILGRTLPADDIACQPENPVWRRSARELPSCRPSAHNNRGPQVVSKSRQRVSSVPDTRPQIARKIPSRIEHGLAKGRCKTPGSGPVFTRVRTARTWQISRSPRYWRDSSRQTNAPLQRFCLTLLCLTRYSRLRYDRLHPPPILALLFPPGAAGRLAQRRFARSPRPAAG